ncbi:MAG: inorganic diphosphatase [Saprospiraceae bacterium]
MDNPWHFVRIGDDAPKIVQAIIEIPRGSKTKYELDKETGMLRLDRVLYSSVYYPYNYGFIPQTYCDDNDPLDILVLTQVKVLPMCIMNAKVIGVMRMIDDGEADDKIIAVSPDDMSVSHINCIEDVPSHALRELKAFFEDYKKLENKTVEVADFQNKEKAWKIIDQSIIDYKAFMEKNGN